jgi:endonuclease/exonuclease/phosphatase family metal-dependent hydrolase
MYWLVQLKKRLLFSLLVLLFAHFHFNSFFEFSTENDNETYNNALSVLSYNVRLFNAYEKNPKINVSQFFTKLIKEQNPDVLFVQEYFHENEISFSDYPFNFIHYNDSKGKFGHALFSKFPIINTGAFDFEDSNNNTLFADIIIRNDTIRVYNLHLQSLGIEPSVSSLQNGDKERLRKRLTRTFKKQQSQSDMVIQHKSRSPFPVLMCGDFNNTSFSYVYRKLKSEMRDAFVEKGSGIGTTYMFDFYPMRLDYIMTSNDFDIVEFKTHHSSFSDHFPISATLGWN